MDRDELRTALTAEYRRDRWIEIVRDIFANVSVYRQPARIEVDDAKVRAFHQLGSVTLEDNRHLALFEVELHDKVQLTRNRVGVRNLIARLIDQAEIHGALGVFIPSAADDGYRFTFAAKDAHFTDDDEFVQTETAPKRYTYLLGPYETCVTAARRFAELKEKGERIRLDDVREAFSVERLNREFYARIREFYARLVGGVSDGREVEGALRLPSGNDDFEQRKSFAVRLLARTIFCWFLKHKWRDPDRPLIPAYLLSSDAVSATGGYYHNVLEKLFFQMLNRPVRERNQHLPAGAHLVPFLNGGLFEPKKSDFYELGAMGASVYVGTLVVPDDWFREFFQVLEQYNFTIDENTVTDAAVSIDPEILGCIFENLLAEINPETGESARKAKGSFYTPRTVVDYMVEESLLAHLLAVLDGVTEDDIRPLFDPDTDETGLPPKTCRAIVEALSRIKVLDPACGSGAFPVGTLQAMLTVLRKADPENEIWVQAAEARVREKDLSPAEQEQILEAMVRALEGNEADYGRKLILIENCLYGVDIDPIAVEIARLRFFLTLVVEETIDDSDPEGNRGIQPLPNLEFKLVCANSLLHAPEMPDPASAGQLALEFDEDRFFDQLREATHEYFTARGPKQKNALRERIRHLVEGQAHQAFERINRLVLHTEENARKALETRHGKAIGDLTRVGNAWRSYANLFSGDPVDFFEPKYIFPDAADGFDIVIGNPPYVRQEKIQHLKPLLKAEYADFAGTADLYVYFYLRGLDLLREGGHLCYISSNKFFRSRYGEKLRARLLADSAIQRLIDFGDAPVFDAIAYPCIVLFEKGGREAGTNEFRALPWRPGPSIDEFADIARAHSFAMPQSALDGDAWRLEHPNVLALLDKLRASGTPLGEYVDGRFYYGIKTGCNEAFVVDRATRDRLIADDPKSADLLKPFLRGRDVKRWRVQPQDLWLIFTRHGTDIEQYPAVKAHLQNYRKRLEPRPKDWKNTHPGERWPGRKPGPYKWYEIQDNIAYWQEFQQPKIVVPAIDSRANYAVDLENHFGNDKTSICVAENANFIAATLNSSPLWWYMRKIAATRQGGFIEFKPMYVATCPIPNIPESEQSPLVELVERILAAKRADASADVSALEREIDRFVYALYNLTAAEIALIEQAGGEG